MPLLLIRTSDALAVALVLCVLASVAGHVRGRRRPDRHGRTPAQRRAAKRGRVADDWFVG